MNRKNIVERQLARINDLETLSTSNLKPVNDFNCVKTCLILCCAPFCFNDGFNSRVALMKLIFVCIPIEFHQSINVLELPAAAFVAWFLLGKHLSHYMPTILFRV